MSEEAVQLDEAANDRRDGATQSRSVRLARLVRRAREAHGSAAREIDWTIPVRPPRWPLRRCFASLVAQLRDGETATALICDHLAGADGDPDVEAFFGLQAADERCHADLYQRYLERLDMAPPADLLLGEVLERGLSWDGSRLAVIIAYHVVIEGEALHAQQRFLRDVPCPLYQSLAAHVIRDEARHVAFGRIFLEGRLGALPLDERLEMYRWVRSMWRDCASAAARHRVFGLLPRALGRDALDARWTTQYAALARLGLILPHEHAAFAGLGPV